MKPGKSNYYTVGEYLEVKGKPDIPMEVGQKIKAEAAKLSEERFIEIKYKKGYGLRYRLEAPKFQEKILIEVLEKFKI